ncbi:hypothetical protein P7K49_012375 [Saguinus oedipus]|uniref:Uncharacterized protein n=1 Tax=Saguinus oedipus TaxID=9490 RepID=A0ABQ9VVN9_SAGOE|nr:hypothetical protein P7K49_012375 [Saguinus oedipus]
MSPGTNSASRLPPPPRTWGSPRRPWLPRDQSWAVCASSTLLGEPSGLAEKQRLAQSTERDRGRSLGEDCGFCVGPEDKFLRLHQLTGRRSFSSLPGEATTASIFAKRKRKAATPWSEELVLNPGSAGEGCRVHRRAKTFLTSVSGGEDSSKAMLLWKGHGKRLRLRSQLCEERGDGATVGASGASCHLQHCGARRRGRGREGIRRGRGGGRRKKRKKEEEEGEEEGEEEEEEEEGGKKRRKRRGRKGEQEEEEEEEEGEEEEKEEEEEQEEEEEERKVEQEEEKEEGKDGRRSKNGLVYEQTKALGAAPQLWVGELSLVYCTVSIVFEESACLEAGREVRKSHKQRQSSITKSELQYYRNQWLFFFRKVCQHLPAGPQLAHAPERAGFPLRSKLGPAIAAPFNCQGWWSTPGVLLGPLLLLGEWLNLPSQEQPLPLTVVPAAPEARRWRAVATR